MRRYPFDSSIGAPILDPDATGIYRGDYWSNPGISGQANITLGGVTLTTETGQIEFSGLLLQGDMQSGTDRLLLQGDMQSGSDKFLSQEVL